MKYRSSSSGNSIALAGPADGALDQPGAPPTGLAGATLPPLLPLLWYLIYSCSLPYVLYYLIFDSVCDFMNHSTFVHYSFQIYTPNLIDTKS